MRSLFRFLTTLLLVALVAALAIVEGSEEPRVQRDREHPDEDAVQPRAPLRGPGHAHLFELSLEHRIERRVVPRHHQASDLHPTRWFRGSAA